ncbi:MAG TPA: methylated-DNA--[protein]-cysteine S-methyltransferase [Terracidiphilus sp.]|nr:methylated-DNA--[protein]-cysteine S-methyltransferase [Terracidiphilus sp.]
MSDDADMTTSVLPAMGEKKATTMDAETAWRHVVARDADAGFFYAVTTTGVFCRPGCASRRPRRQNVRFFVSAEAAMAAGFRSCQRCKPLLTPRDPIAMVRAYLERHADRHVSLSELARVTGLSAFTVQRSFKKAMGVSPLQYQRGLRTGRLRSALRQGGRVTDAIYEAGFGSSSRAYDSAALGMTPTRFARGGNGERIRFTTARTPFGWMVVGATQRGLCWLALGDTSGEAEATLRGEFPEAVLRRDASLRALVAAALDRVREGEDLGHSARHPAALDLRGTVFQLRVWQALRQIPRGQTRTYGQLAREMGEPKATRAVARACAVNRVAILVPCHRVVGAGGSLTGYRWGVDRKRQLLESEGTDRA